MTADVIALTGALCAIPSPTGGEGAVVARAEELLAGRGWTVARHPVTPGRDNLIAWRDHPEVVLSTHLDTVPPHIPFQEEADCLVGRGTVDAKGIAAAMIVAADRLAEEGERRVGLLLLVGEEDGSDGALAAGAMYPRGRFLVNGEPTENRLAVGQKGTLRARVLAEGRAAHSGYPEEGRSAIDALLEALTGIRRLPLPEDPVLGPCTVNIGLIGGGVAPNVIPPRAWADLLFRTVGRTDQLRAEITRAAGSAVSVSFPLEIPPVHGHPLSGWDTTVVAYTSDWPLLADWGRTYQLGPGSIRVAHTPEERISKRDLHDGVDAYARLARQLLSEP